MDQNPLSRCDVARASFDLREDFEALLDDVREEPDHSPLEARMSAKSVRALDSGTDLERVEARLVRFALEGISPGVSE